LELFASTRRERLLSKNKDLDVAKIVCQRLAGFISTIPDLSQPTHWLEKKDALGGILFLPKTSSWPSPPEGKSPHR
jgi:hypothetical protein